MVVHDVQYEHSLNIVIYWRENLMNRCPAGQKSTKASASSNTDGCTNCIKGTYSENGLKTISQIQKIVAEIII